MAEATPWCIIRDFFLSQGLHVYSHIVFIHDFYASHRFDYVFHGNHSSQTSVFIHDDRDVFSFFQHLFPYLVQEIHPR